MPGPGHGDTPPMRLAGYALLAVAGVAAIIGLVSLAGGGSEASPDPSVAQPGASAGAIPSEPAAAPPPAEAAPATPAPATPAPVGGAPAPAAPPTAATPGLGPTQVLPGAGLPKEGSGSGGSGSAGSGSGGSGSAGSGSGGSGKGGFATVVKAPVRVYNNSLIKGLAERAADDIRGSGWDVTAVGNYPDGTIPTSTVYYRPGTSEESAARSLASSFGLRCLPRFAGLDNAHAGLIVIVTKDYQRR